MAGDTDRVANQHQGSVTDFVDSDVSNLDSNAVSVLYAFYVFYLWHSGSLSQQADCLNVCRCGAVRMWGTHECFCMRMMYTFAYRSIEYKFPTVSVADLHQFTAGTPSEQFPFMLQMQYFKCQIHNFTVSHTHDICLCCPLADLTT